MISIFVVNLTFVFFLLKKGLQKPLVGLRDSPKQEVVMPVDSFSLDEMIIVELVNAVNLVLFLSS